MMLCNCKGTVYGREESHIFLISKQNRSLMFRHVSIQIFPYCRIRTLIVHQDQTVLHLCLFNPRKQLVKIL